MICQETINFLLYSFNTLKVCRSDIAIAEEAVVTASFMGNNIEKAYDVGVAGIHRLFDIKDKISEANVIIVVAGMEGALVSIAGGLTSKPVIAVPTSVRYGACFEGIAPLLTMMNSCAEGVVVGDYPLS